MSCHNCSTWTRFASDPDPRWCPRCHNTGLASVAALTGALDQIIDDAMISSCGVCHAASSTARTAMERPT